jgi:hypothetical protein
MIAIDKICQEVRLNEIEDSFRIGDDSTGEMFLTDTLFLL